MNDSQDSLFEELLAGSGFTETSLPQYVISGSGWGWYLDPEEHQMVRIARGQEIVLLPGEPDEYNRLLVRAPFRFLMIHESEVQEIGWN